MLIGKEELFDRAYIKIYEYLDVVNFILFNENFEKLKSLIFDDEQVIYFDFLRGRAKEDIFKENYENKIFSIIMNFKNKIN